MTGLLVAVAYAGVVVAKWPRYYLVLIRYDRERFPSLDIEVEDRVILALVAVGMAVLWPLVVLAGLVRGPFLALLTRIEDER